MPIALLSDNVSKPSPKRQPCLLAPQPTKIFDLLGPKRLCACQTAPDGLCTLLTRWIEPWRTDPRFKSTYKHYLSWHCPIVPSQAFLSSRIHFHAVQHKSQLSAHNLAILTRVLTCFEKHLIYYGHSYSETEQRELYVLVLMGLSFHCGGSSAIHLAQQEVLFWALQYFYRKLQYRPQRAALSQALNGIHFFFPVWVQQLNTLQIDWESVVAKWIETFMLEQVSINNMLFLSIRLQEKGWSALTQLTLAYFESIFINYGDLFLKDQQTIRQALFHPRSQEWPLLFRVALQFEIEPE